MNTLYSTLNSNLPKLRKPINSLVKSILLFLFFTSEIACAQQWFYSFVPRGRHINSIEILDSTHIVVGGGNEFNDSLQDIFLSSDKGLTWDFSANSIKPWIKSMDFSDSIHGLSCGYSGTILKTNNGARSWSPVPNPITRQFNKVKFITPQLVFIAGGTVPREDTLQTILKSIDSGKTWSVMLDQKGYWLRNIDFIDANNGTAVGDSGVILRTTNGGANWNTITSPSRENLNSVKFISSTVGYIVGGRGFPDSSSIILQTTNGGASWSILRHDSLGVLNDINFLNSTNGYIVGDHATVLQTTNGGLNWSRVTIPNSYPFDNFNSVAIFSNDLVAVAGRYGSVYIYTTSLKPTAFTFGSQFVDTTKVILKAGINTHGEHGSYVFYYSTDSTLFSYQFSFPATVNSDTVRLVESTVFGLTPNTKYYFFVQAQTLAGITNGDTLSFYTGVPAYTLKTLPATSIGSVNATLNGVVDKFFAPLNVSFEYGTSPFLGNEIPGNPGNVSDTFSHNISAVLNGLQPNTVYYFRLKGMQNSQFYYGDILTFFTGTAFSAFQTLGATNIVDSSANLSGFIDKFQIPVNLSFEFGTTTNFGQEVIAAPSFVNDTLPHNIFGYITHLIPGTQYFFRLKGQTSVTTFYGDILTFNSGIGYSFFNTLDATNITNTSAQINAEGKRFLGNVDLSFEWGTTQSLGNTIAANPSSVSDTLYHAISANLTGLVPDQVYFYRAKAVYGTTVIYGATKQFYAGMTEIPNWDFQFWNSDTITVPDSWSVVQDTFSRVPGHNGYALRLKGQTFVINGYVPDNAPFLGGVPLNTIARPDSVAFYLNYNVAPGDSAFVLVLLKKQAHVLANRFYPITGNSSGTFKRLAYKIMYDSLAVPDSVILAFATSNIIEGKSPYYNNFMDIDDITFIPGNITFANSNFETWFSTFIERPLSWFYVSYLGLNAAQPDSNHMVHKVFFNAPNDFAAEVNNIYWGSPGLVFGGELSTKTGVVDDYAGGFPVRGRHFTFNGYFKFLPVGGDTLQVSVDFKKNGAPVGMGYSLYYDPVPDFTAFSIPITYTDSVNIPDSATIGFRIHNVSGTSGLHQGSKFVVDKLSFDGFVSGIKNIKDLFELDGMKVYPNPARDYVMIENLLTDKKCSLSLFSVKGEIVREIKLAAGERLAKIEVGDLPPGFYVLVMRKGERLFSHKIIIEK